MFQHRLASSIGVVGVDFGARGVKLLQVRQRGPRLHVVGAARVDVNLSPVMPCSGPAPAGNANAKPGSSASSASSAIDSKSVAPPYQAVTDPAALTGDSSVASMTEKLRTAFAAGGFAGRRCVVNLLREDVCMQSLRMPKMPDEEMRQSVMWEASQRFGFDRNAMEVDFIRTGATLQSGESREEVLLIAVPHAALHARLEPVLAAGLRPIAVETGFAALARAFSRQVRRESDRNQVRAVVEVGYSGSTVMILRGDQIAFCKPISIGGRQFNHAVAEHLQVNEQAAVELRAARIAAASGAATAAGPDAEQTPPRSLSTRTEDQKPVIEAATDRAVYEAVRPLMGELVKEVMLCLRYYGVTFRGNPPERIKLAGGDGLEPKLGMLLHQACKTPVVFDDPLGTLAGVKPEIQSTLCRTPGPPACWAVAMGLSMRGMARRKTEQDAAEVAGMRGAA